MISVLLFRGARLEFWPGYQLSSLGFPQSLQANRVGHNHILLNPLKFIILSYPPFGAIYREIEKSRTSQKEIIFCWFNAQTTRHYSTYY
jgi:hypothetical protein